MRHIWSSEEDVVLREIHGRNPHRYAREAASKLGVSLPAVHSRAINLGISSPRGRPPHRWTEEQIDVVRRDYEGTHASRRYIAAKLGLTESMVARKVYEMGLAKTSDRRPWTSQEDARLEELVPRMSLLQVARRMHRSLNSVTVRSNRLGISKRVRDGWYTKKDVCEILGKDHKWVGARIDNGSLKASWHHGRPPCQKGQGAWHIAERDLKVFIRRYCHELNGRNVDLVQVVNVLCGLQTLAEEG